MAYDADLAERVRALVAVERGLAEKRMFGGLAFLINGHLAVSVSGQGGLLLPVDPAETAALVDEPQVQRAVMRGRTMDGWLRVAADSVEDDDVLARWVRRGVDHARSLPPK